MSIVYSIRENCTGCYACVRNCPVKAIRIREGLAEVVRERCIDCGNCTDVCVAKAKVAESDVDKVREFLSQPSDTVAVISTAFPAVFLDCTSKQLVGALKKLGFSDVMEDSYGAEIVGIEYAHYLQEPFNKPAISSNCPAVVNYIRKYQPSLVPNIVPIVSPMIAMGRLVKKFYKPGANVVFISPCVAKKTESMDSAVADAIDGVITFTELKAMLGEKEIDISQVPEEEFDGPLSGIGRFFPISDGLLRIIGLSENIINNNLLSIHGRDYVVKITDEFARGEISTDFAHIYFCHGCIGGPSIDNDLSNPRRKERVIQHARRSEPAPLSADELNNYSTLNLRREFTPDELPSIPCKEDEVVQMVRKLGGTDCGACGYSSCRDLAESVCKGMAEIEMCWPYVLRQLKATQEGLIRTEKLSSLGQMAASIAHEVNNPLAGVLTYTQLLEKKIAGGRFTEDLAMEYLPKMEAELVRSTKLIRNLLDFARQSPPSLQMVSMNEVIIKSLEMAAHSAKLHHIEIVKELDPAIPETMGDFNQLQQVFTNLFINAADAMEGHGRLDIKARFESEKNQFHIRVSDTGPGIPESMREKIFDFFFTTKAPGKGTGLGLTITKNIISLHGGSIVIDSRSEGGTTFIIEIPLGFVTKTEEEPLFIGLDN